MLKGSTTTVIGILTIVAALAEAGVALLSGHQPNWAVVAAQVGAGLGLIKAADQNQKGSN
jgi:hypothetical protein